MDSVKQDRLKVLCSIVSILAKIGKVLCFIGIAGLILFSTVVTMIANGIDFKKHEINVFEQEIKYSVDNDNLVVYLNGEQQDFDFKITGLTEASEKLEKYTSTKIIVSCLVFTAGEIAILAFLIIVLMKTSELFKNIASDDTPFTNQNTVLIHEIANNLVILFIIPIVLSVILSLIVDFNVNLNINFVSVGLILVTYIASIIFEYGTLLQGKSKQKIYATK